VLKVKVKVKVKGHVIRALSWILGMSYSVIDGLVDIILPGSRNPAGIPGLEIPNPESQDWENGSGIGIPIDSVAVWLTDSLLLNADRR